MNIQAALDEVRGIFPFENYLYDMAVHSYLAHLITERLLPGGGRILDIGAGPCDKLAVFARMGYRCDAFDDFGDAWHQISDNLDRIRTFARTFDISLHEGNVHSILSDAGRFDLVMLNDIIEHLHQSPREILNLAISCLREGGWCVVTMPNSVNLRKRLSVAFGKTNYPSAHQFFNSRGQWRGHVREWTPKESEDLLRWMKLEALTVKTFHGMVGQKIRSPLVQALYRMFSAALPATRDSICAWGRRPVGWIPVEPQSLSNPFTIKL